MIFKVNVGNKNTNRHMDPSWKSDTNPEAHERQSVGDLPAAERRKRNGGNALGSNVLEDRQLWLLGDMLTTDFIIMVYAMLGGYVTYQGFAKC